VAVPVSPSASGEVVGKTQEEISLEFVLPEWASAQEYVFLASVSSEWRRRMLKKSYDDLERKREAALPKKLSKHVVPVVTAVHAALRSSARLRWALDNSKLTKSALKTTSREFVRTIVDLSVDPVRVLQLLNLRTLKQVESSKGLKLCATAVAEDNSDQLKWLFERGCPWGLSSGQPATLKHITHDKCLQLCATAAGQGNLDLLECLHERSCPWDDSTLIAAAKQGHTDLVTWAQEHDCPWHLHSCSPMEVSAHIQRICGATHGKYQEFTKLRVTAAQCGSRPLMQWLRTLGCPWNEEVCLVASDSTTVGTQ
jgi:hypothetical protein